MSSTNGKLTLGYVIIIIIIIIITIIIIIIKCVYKAHFRGCHECAKNSSYTLK